MASNDNPIPAGNAGFRGIPDSMRHLYQVLIMNDKRGVLSSEPEYFSCFTPDSLSISLSSKWTRVFDNQKDGGMQLGSPVVGMELSDPAFTALVYKRTEPFVLKIKFQLIGNAPEEVRRQLAALIRMTVPTLAAGGLGVGGVILPPGPSLAGYATGRLATLANQWIGEDKFAGLGQNISMAYGKKMFFPSIVITDVDLEIPSRWTSDGDFTVASGVMTIKTFTTPFAREINQMLGLADDPNFGDGARTN